MKDKDKEAFEKWWDNLYSNQMEWRDWQGCDIVFNGKEDMRCGWQAACEYKQKEINELEKEKDYLCQKMENMRAIYKDSEKLQAENAKLRECVQFYANIVSWDKCGGERIRIKDDDIYLMNNLPFGGKRARQVLKELDEK